MTTLEDQLRALGLAGSPAISESTELDATYAFSAKWGAPMEASYSGVPVTRRERYTLQAARRVFDVLRGTSFHEDAVSVLNSTRG